MWRSYKCYYKIPKGDIMKQNYVITKSCNTQWLGLRDECGYSCRYTLIREGVRWVEKISGTGTCTNDLKLNWVLGIRS